MAPPINPGHCAVRKMLVEDDGLRPAEWELSPAGRSAQRPRSPRLDRVPRGDQDDPALVETWL